MNTTFVIIKPDAVARKLVGQITTRFENKGLQLLGCNMINCPKDLLVKHYHHLVNKPYYPDIEASMTMGPVVLQIWRGYDAVSVVRTLLGSTNPSEALPGTIRGDFSSHIGRNLCHASDSEENARQEIQLWGTTLPY